MAISETPMPYSGWLVGSPLPSRSIARQPIRVAEMTTSITWMSADNDFSLAMTETVVIVRRARSIADTEQRQQ